MKKILQHSLLAAAAVLTIGTTACTSEYEYEPASKDAALLGNAFFQSATTRLHLLPTDKQEITFTMARIDTTLAQDITLICSNEAFSVPATVSFSAGEATKDILATFDIPTGTTQTVTFSVADEDAYLYGLKELNFSVTRFAEYSGVFVSEAFEAQWETPIYQIGAASYQVPDVYEENVPLVFTIQADGSVIVEPQLSWMHPSYGEVWMLGNALEDGDAAGGGSHVAGTYDAGTGLVDLHLLMYVPGLGSFGTFNEQLVFIEDEE